MAATPYCSPGSPSPRIPPGKSIETYEMDVYDFAFVLSKERIILL